MQIYVGIDDGNYDVKTPNTTTPGGYTAHSSLPAMTEEYLLYNGTYYVPDQERFEYLEDKTINERCLILTLFGLAKEIRYIAEKKSDDLQDIQEEISKMTKVAIGAGLPPSQWNKLRKKKLEYYKEQMSKEIEFEYCGLHYRTQMNFCQLYPQAWAAIVVNSKNEIIQNYNRFYAVDIGGGTMDIIQFIDGNPQTNKCDSEELGVLFMYQQIASDIKRSLGTKIDNKDIENIILKKNTVLPENVIAAILVEVQRWVDNKIINKLSQSKINFDSTPILFLGGGSILLKPFINKNEIIHNHHYLSNAARANAKGYQIMVRNAFKEC